MATMNQTEPRPPLTLAEAAHLLRVGVTTVRRMVGLEWVEYQGRGRRPIRRITRESVERMLQRRARA
jgi:hypothetical protein